MNVQQSIRDPSPDTTEHFDVADRRRRHLRRRRRLSPDQAVPGHELRRAGNAGELRRHLAAPTAIPASAPTATCYTFGYRFKPWTSAPIATAAEILQLHGRGDRGERPRPPHPLSATGSPRRAGRARTICWTIEATRTDTGEAVRFTANFLWMCQGYYRHSEGYTPEWDGHGGLQGPHRPSADLARRSRLQGQEGRRHRLGRHGGDADPGDRRTTARMSRCCSARRPISAPAATRSRSPTSCASCRSTRPGSTRSCAGRSCTTRTSSPAGRSPSRRR